MCLIAQWSVTTSPSPDCPGLLTFSCCRLSALIKQFIRENSSGISVELGSDLSMNHDNVSHCLRSDKDYEDECRGAHRPLPSQRRAAAPFLMLTDLSVIIAADKQSWRKQNFSRTEVLPNHRELGCAVNSDTELDGRNAKTSHAFRNVVICADYLN